MSAIGDRGEAGTTLIEALAVVAISTLVALIGFPRLQQALLTLAQRQTVTAVAARLREAHGDALRFDRRTVFAISGSGRLYGAGAWSAETPPGVSLFARGGESIAFYGDGSSSGGSLWVSAGRRSLRVDVSPATAEVTVGG